MANPRQHRNWILGNRLRAATVALVSAISLVLMVFATKSAQAQTLNVIYSFTGGRDGADPRSALTKGPGGVLYGTTISGGDGYGGVFELKPSGSGWILNPLYIFTGGVDGG